MRKDVLEFYERRKRRLLARGLRLDGKRDKMRSDEWQEELHPRDDAGRFSTSGGGGAKSGENKSEKKEPKLPSAKSIGFVPKTKSLYRNVRDSLVARHKALRKCQGLDGLPDCTVDPDTGKMVTFDDGFQVSFQTSLSEGSEDGALSDEEYDGIVEELRRRTGSKPYVGVFEEAETSFHCKTRRDAMRLAKQFNQQSILDWKAMKKYENKEWTPEVVNAIFVPNPNYDPSKNHVKGL